MESRSDGRGRTTSCRNGRHGKTKSHFKLALEFPPKYVSAKLKYRPRYKFCRMETEILIHKLKDTMRILVSGTPHGTPYDKMTREDYGLVFETL